MQDTYTTHKNSRPLHVRFWAKVEKGTTDECWPWLGGVNANGYGNIWNIGRQILAYKVAWVLTNGERTEGNIFRHQCESKLCVNPHHLFVGTLLAWKSKLFWSHVNKNTVSGCWEWTGGKCSDGYGTFNSGIIGGGAHRIAWTLLRGEIGNSCVLHRCDNRACVNPEHLYLDTQEENIKDMIRKDRHCRGERSPNAKLTDADVKDIRSKRITVTEFASLYQTVGTNVSNIQARRAWRHVK